MVETKQTRPVAALTHATFCVTPEQSNREWQQQLEGLSCLISALLAKAVSALTGCWEMEEQLCGVQPQDRQHDSSKQERGECTMFLSVCLRGEKPKWRHNLLPTKRVISPPVRSLKDIDTRAHTRAHSGEKGMQRLEGLPVSACCLNSNM